MKKITLLLAGFMMSGVASATVPLTASGSVTVLQCTLLNEDVSINLTTGVEAGISCNGVGIAMAACHTGGRQTSRSAMIDSAGANCGNGAGQTPCTGTLVSTPVTGAAMPLANTESGTVVTQYPGTGTCTAAKAETVATTAVTALQ